MTSRHVFLGALVFVAFAGPGPASAKGSGEAGSTSVDAAKAGNLEAVRTLLKQPKAANVASKDGTTALHWATDLDNLPMAQALVRAGANVKAANRYGVTPMYSAAVT